MGTDFKPIIRMSVLFKLASKYVNEAMQLEVDYRDIMAKNQIEAVISIQEQVLINKAIK